MSSSESKIFYSPASILAVYNAQSSVKEEKTIIQVRGIFLKVGTTSYGGIYYDRLKDEASDNKITLVTPALIHNQLDNNKTIEFNGYLTRKTDKEGRIEIHVHLTELIEQRVNKYSETDVKKIELINTKVALGFSDLDAHIKNAIFNNRKISIKVIMGKAAIIDSDIKKGMVDAVALYNLDYHKVSLTSPEEIIKTIKSLDVPGTDVICVARGGGENLDVFDSPEICEALIGRKAIIASAIGHADNVTLFEKLADKKFSTPTAFGNYLKEIYNKTIEEFQDSKAKIIKDARDEVSTVYKKQLENLNEQLLATKQLNERTLAETNKNYAEQVQNLNEKLKALEELRAKSTQEITGIHEKEIANYTKQLEEVKAMNQEQVTQAARLQTEKVASLNEQILALQSQQKQSASIIAEVKDISAKYQSQVEQGYKTRNMYIILALVAGILGVLIGYFLSK